MDLNETVCFCGSVTVGDIKAAVEAGNTTLEAVQEATGAGTHCGGCVDKVAGRAVQEVSVRKSKIFKGNGETCSPLFWCVTAPLW